jgi:hypothetical protein
MTSFEDSAELDFWRNRVLKLEADLRTMRTEEYKEWCEAHGEWPPAQEVLARLPAENKTLRAEIERLRTALKPFAEAYTELLRQLVEQQEPMPAYHSIDTSDLANARRALEEAKNAP